MGLDYLPPQFEESGDEAEEEEEDDAEEQVDEMEEGEDEGEEKEEKVVVRKRQRRMHNTCMACGENIADEHFLFCMYCCSPWGTGKGEYHKDAEACTKPILFRSVTMGGATRDMCLAHAQMAEECQNDWAMFKARLKQ